MIRIEKTKVYGFDAAIRGMRNPMNSWEKSDSEFYYQDCGSCLHSLEDNCQLYDCTVIGKNDLELMKNLSKAGTDHSKYLRFITVTADITAPLYWWKEFDTYKVGTVANSCSTMHKIHAKEFTLDDFSHEHLISEYNTQKYYEPTYDEENAEVRPVFGFADYDVSETGVVYSWKSGERVALKQRVDIDGYKTVGLYEDGKCKRFKVHRIVAEAFLDKVEGNGCVNHKDGNKWNNAANNLEWCSRSENSLHASKNGLLVYGSKQRIGTAKNRRFTKEQISTIKELYFSENVSQRELGRLFGCDHSVISEIINDKIYKDIAIYPLEMLELTIEELNRLRESYLESGDKAYWYSMIQLLPSSYNQKRTVLMNYQVLKNMYHARKNHKLDEWHDFCNWCEDLPHAKELIC